MRAIVDSPLLQGVRLVLTTRDAHGLYEQFGFRHLASPEQWMIRPEPI
jgi:hypothetical protein